MIVIVKTRMYVSIRKKRGEGGKGERQKRGKEYRKDHDNSYRRETCEYRILGFLLMLTFAVATECTN